MQRFLTALCITWGTAAFAHDIISESSVYIQQDPLVPEKPIQPIPDLEPQHKSSFLAVGLSALLPGLGHVYLGDYKTASEFFLVPLGCGSLNSLKDLHQYIGPTLEYTWYYGIFAAYRDVRIFNNEVGYRYKIPKDSLADLSTAPFRWRIMEKPEVWGGILGYLLAGSTISYFAFKGDKHSKCDVPKCDVKDRVANPLIAFPVGVGEEVLFRGYLQSSLSEIFTAPGGIALTSVLFALAHIPKTLEWSKKERSHYCTYIVPYLATFGAYEGWLTYKNKSLQESVAIHAWYDFILFSLSYTAAPAAITRPHFATSFNF